MLPPREHAQLKAVATEFSERLRKEAEVPQTGPTAMKRGMLLLFRGTAGTGKTMAARTLAHELHLGLIEADLTSSVFRDGGRAARLFVARLFANGAAARAILAFDHLDALLTASADGQPSDLRSKAANPADLLARSDEYPGIVIFTTNSQHVVDDTVRGRFDHVIAFPEPARAERKKIWRRHLAGTGVTEDDLTLLASAGTVTGAEIATCCAGAKESAARQGGPVHLGHITPLLESRCAASRMSRDSPAALERLGARKWAGTREQSPSRRPDSNAPAGPAARAHVGPPPEPAPTGGDAEPMPVWAAAEADTAKTTARATVASTSSRTTAAPAARRSRSSPRWLQTLALPSLRLAFRLPLPRPSPPELARHLSRVSPSGAWAIAALTGIAIAAGLGLALAGSADQGSAFPTLDLRATAGAALVSYPRSWQKRNAPASLGPGIGNAIAVSPPGAPQRLLVIGTSATRPSPVLPPQFLTTSPGTAVGQVVRLGSLWFYRFPNVAVGSDPPAAVYALPTTAGTVISVCRPASAGFTSACERILSALALRRGVQIVASNINYARELSAAIAKLNTVRRAGAAQLAAARTATAESIAESRLADAHAQAASTIAKLNASSAQAANAALVSALEMTAHAYAAMAQAAVQQDPGGYRAATASLGAAVAATTSAFADLRQLGYYVG